jgi:hypothetical protein
MPRLPCNDSPNLMLLLNRCSVSEWDTLTGMTGIPTHTWPVRLLLNIMMGEHAAA